MNFYSSKMARRIAKEQAKRVVVNRDAMCAKTLVVKDRNGREIERIEVVAKASEIERKYWNTYGEKCADAAAKGYYLFCDRSEPRELPDAITETPADKTAVACERRNGRLARSAVHV